MTSPFDCMIPFPVSRAQAYPHTWPVDPSPEDAPIVDLGVDHLIVDTLVYPGTVTLAATTRNADNDAYGQEYDLTPADARALGHQLIAAAAHCEGAMAWVDLLRDEDGEVLSASGVHCPCDGYAPPPGGRPLTSSDFAAAGLVWGGD